MPRSNVEKLYSGETVCVHLNDKDEADMIFTKGQVYVGNSMNGYMVSIGALKKIKPLIDAYLKMEQ